MRGRLLHSNQLRETSPRVGVVTGRKLLDQLWANGPQPKISTWGCAKEKDQPRALEVFHCRDSLEKEFMFSRLPGQKLLDKIRMAEGTPKTLNPWAFVGSAWFPRHTTALGSNTRADAVSSSTPAGVVPLRFHIFVFFFFCTGTGIHSIKSQNCRYASNRSARSGAQPSAPPKG